jgi:hypothetical protein
MESFKSHDDKPIVTFGRIGYLGPLYDVDRAELYEVQGHPHLGDTEYVYTSRVIRVIGTDGHVIPVPQDWNAATSPTLLAGVVEIETRNTIYRKRIACLP